MDKLNIWVICQYFSEERYNEICSDDLNEFLQLFPYQRIFQCIGKDNKFMYLKQGDGIYRVRESLLILTEEPKFKIGETVILKNKTAIVASISWHYKYKEPIYIVKVDGKIKKTRYFAKDLQKV